MTLCQKCLNRETCKRICNALKREITGRGKTASLKPKTYPIDVSHIENPQEDINDFQKEVLRAIAALSEDAEDGLMIKYDLNEAIQTVLNENEKRVIALFMDGYKQDEISANMGISQPRVNFLFQRAIKKLKKILL
jgi:RNA polymerase sigma factor (sigma-70 family)